MTCQCTPAVNYFKVPTLLIHVLLRHLYVQVTYGCLYAGSEWVMLSGRWLCAQVVSGNSRHGTQIPQAQPGGDAAALSEGESDYWVVIVATNCLITNLISNVSGTWTVMWLTVNCLWQIDQRHTCLFSFVLTSTWRTCKDSWLWRLSSPCRRLQQPCWGSTQRLWLSVVRIQFTDYFSATFPTTI